MHPHQKAAWFNLIGIAAIVVIYAARVFLLSWRFGLLWTHYAVPSVTFLGLTGALGGVVLFYRPSSKGTPVTDERDYLLFMRARFAGMMSFLFVFLIGSLVIRYMFYVRGVERVTVPVGLFPCMAYASLMFILVIHSITILHYYGWRANNASRG